MPNHPYKVLYDTLITIALLLATIKSISPFSYPSVVLRPTTTTKITFLLVQTNDENCARTRNSSTRTQQNDRKSNKLSRIPVVVTGNVTVIYESDQFLVVSKPPTVVCHHSDWTGLRKSYKDRSCNDDEYPSNQIVNALPEVSMIERVREAFGGRRVNLVHRLDRGASGCLMMTFGSPDVDNNNLNCDVYHVPNTTTLRTERSITTKYRTDNTLYRNNSNMTDMKTKVLTKSQQTNRWIKAIANPTTNKTYIALVRGEGILNGRDMKKDGWFLVDRPIKNERGTLKNASTWFRFVAGQHSFRHTTTPSKNETVLVLDPTIPRASLVLARPITGRWHQIRRHLNGLSHPILGDSTHGNTATNREWRELRGLPYGRTCLHLSQIQISEEYNPNKNISSLSRLSSTNDSSNKLSFCVNCDLPQDMMDLLKNHLPDVLKDAEPILKQEGIVLQQQHDNDTFSCTNFRRIPFSVKI